MLTAELNFAGKGQRRWHAINALVGAITRSNHRGIRARFEFGVMIHCIAKQMTSSKGKLVIIIKQRTRRIVHNLTILTKPRHPTDCLGSAAHADGLNQLGQRSLRLAAHHIHISVGQTFCNEMRGAGSHQHYLCIGPVMAEHLNSRKVGGDREVDRPNQINVRIIGSKKSIKLNGSSLVIYKVAIHHRIGRILLQHGCSSEFIYIRRKVDHTGASGSTFSRLLVVEAWRDYESKLHRHKFLYLFNETTGGYIAHKAEYIGKISLPLNIPAIVYVK